MAFSLLLPPTVPSQSARSNSKCGLRHSFSYIEAVRHADKLLDIASYAMCTEYYITKTVGGEPKK
jgi:hypothetical protein